MNTHEKYMQRCLDLAIKGLGNTYPNPLVGSVIVYNNKIVGEGYHTKAGENHAEINAINSVKDKSLLSKSTLYVNLEPCSHYGKTPPCAKRIAELKIPQVVIGTVDTTDKVAGKGIKILRDAGVNVITDVLYEKSREINKRFFTFHEKKRPYIILKWAQSADGYLDPQRDETYPQQPVWITGHTERILVHKWRTEEQAIAIGTNTAKIDNPQLTARYWTGESPVRIIIDRNLQLRQNLFIYDKTVKTFIFNTLKDSQENQNLTFVKISEQQNFIYEIISYIYKLKKQSLIVEGGKVFLQSFINEKLWDEARFFVGSKFFNGGTKAPAIDVKKSEIRRFNESWYFSLRNL